MSDATHTVTVEIAPLLEDAVQQAPPTPLGLLRLAAIFTRAGNPNTAAYLRRCADQMAINYSEATDVEKCVAVRAEGLYRGGINIKEGVIFSLACAQDMDRIKHGSYFLLVPAVQFPLDVPGTLRGMNDSPRDLQAEAAQASDRG